jgi:hypothetical protein
VKELNWLKGGHFEFHDSPVKVAQAAGEVAHFVKSHTSPDKLALAN